MGRLISIQTNTNFARKIHSGAAVYIATLPF